MFAASEWKDVLYQVMMRLKFLLFEVSPSVCNPFIHQMLAQKLKSKNRWQLLLEAYKQNKIFFNDSKSFENRSQLQVSASLSTSSF